MTKKQILHFLRKEIKECEKDIFYFQSLPMGIEEFDHTRQLLGTKSGYMRLIKVIRNLSEREYQLEIKRGTL